MSEAFDRCVAFMRAMEARAAERTERTDHGAAYLAPSLPRVWYRNVLSVDLGAEATADELALEAEAVQGRAGLAHRRVQIDDELGARVAHGFRALVWDVEEDLVMVDTGEPPPEASNSLLLGPRRSAVVELDGEALAPVWAEGMRETQDDEETVRQLVEAQLGRREAVHVRYFAWVDEGGVAAYCELFSRDGIGQIESVMTLPRFRGRGFGKAVVAHALAESRAAGHELTFLVADANDWPKELYRKLGFADVGRVWDFTRKPGATAPS
jgi:ribosomal protein S18 acetylase RimI-like enzyme